MWMLDAAKLGFRILALRGDAIEDVANALGASCGDH